MLVNAIFVLHPSMYCKWKAEVETGINGEGIEDTCGCTLMQKLYSLSATAAEARKEYAK